MVNRSSSDVVVAGGNASSSSPRSSSASFHSPTTVQTNVSPAFADSKPAGSHLVHPVHSGLPSFSYIQTKQLPTPPPQAPTVQPTSTVAPVAATVHSAINSVGLTVVPTPAHSSSTHFKPAAPLPSQSRYVYPPPEGDTGSSRASSRVPEVSVPAGVEAAAAAVTAPPVIVEALPRDQVVLGEDYRTLTREDELRQSIKLKESSLI